MLYQLVLSINLVFEHIDDEVLRCKHILQVASQCIETVMRAFLSLFAVNRHSTFVASVGARAIVLLVVHNVKSLYFLVAVNARDHYIGTGCLMQIYIFPECLSFTFGKRLALNRLKIALLVMTLHHIIAQRQITSKVLVLAVELHGSEFFLNLFPYVDKAGFFALERALPGFSRKLIQTNLVEPILALFALPGVFQDG